MTNDDAAGMRRLLGFLHDAIAAQDLPMQDQLHAALREGDTRLRIEQSAVAPVLVVSVAGADLLEVDVRNLVEP